MGDVIVFANQSFNGDPFGNALCFNNFQEDETFLQSWADDFRATWDFHVKDQLSNLWILHDISVSFLLVDSVDYSVTVSFTDGELVGTDVSDGYAPNAPLLVSTSYVGSRPNRGRIYFSGLTEASINNGIYNTGTRDKFEDMVDGWKDGLVLPPDTTFMRILRRPSNVFTSYISNPISLVGSTGPARNQRRRQRA